MRFPSTLLGPVLILEVFALIIDFVPGRHSPVIRRLGVSVMIGTAAGAVLAAWVDQARHTALADVPRGSHVTAAGSLLAGFAITMLGVTVLTFVLLTITASRRRAAAGDRADRRGTRRADLTGARPARRRAAARGGDL